MLKLFDRYYRKGDPKAMAVSSSFFSVLVCYSDLTYGLLIHISTVLKRYKISTEVNLALRFTLTNMISF